MFILSTHANRAWKWVAETVTKQGCQIGVALTQLVVVCNLPFKVYGIRAEKNSGVNILNSEQYIFHTKLQFAKKDGYFIWKICENVP